MAKFLRKPTPILTPGALIAEAARKVDAVVAARDALDTIIDDESVGTLEVEVETSIEFDIDGIVDCADDKVEYGDVVAKVAGVLGIETTDEQSDALMDLLSDEIGSQIKATVRASLEKMNVKVKDGVMHLTENADVLLKAVRAGCEDGVEFARQDLRNVERAAIAKHNAEVREANAKVLPMTKPEPTPARRDVLAAAVEALDDPRFVEKLAASVEPTPTAPGDVVVEALEAFRKDYNYEGVAAMTKPKAKKPRAPRKAKAAPAAEAAPAAPEAPAKHPVDIAEALLVLDDVNAPPEAIAAALAILAE